MKPHLRIIFSLKKRSIKLLKPLKSSIRGIETWKERLKTKINENKIFLNLIKGHCRRCAEVDPIQNIT